MEFGPKRLILANIVLCRASGPSQEGQLKLSISFVDAAIHSLRASDLRPTNIQQIMLPRTAIAAALGG